jgi:hypothetical protein
MHDFVTNRSRRGGVKIEECAGQGGIADAPSGSAEVV